MAQIFEQRRAHSKPHIDIKLRCAKSTDIQNLGAIFAVSIISTL